MEFADLHPALTTFVLKLDLENMRAVKDLHYKYIFGAKIKCFVLFISAQSFNDYKKCGENFFPFRNVNNFPGNGIPLLFLFAHFSKDHERFERVWHALDLVIFLKSKVCSIVT